jgi:hypothetical protein
MPIFDELFSHFHRDFCECRVDESVIPQEERGANLASAPSFFQSTATKAERVLWSV